MRRVATLCLVLVACRVELGAPRAAAGSGPATVHVYTSMYKPVIDALKPTLAAELARTAPGTTVEWFQSASEKVASRLDAELASGGSPCDVLLTSDLPYYARLKAAGRLVPYVSPAALRQPRSFVDPDGAWATARLSVMVLAASKAVAQSGRAPATFGELASRADLKVALGDPLSSGTSFFTVSTLLARYGWSWLADLKARGAVVAGGNATVLQRVQSGESDVGLVLLENVLAARARGDAIAPIFPGDGAVIVPGPIALLEHARHVEAARALIDALLSPPVQRAMVERGYLHSPDPAVAPPAGAPPLDALLAKATPPSTDSAEAIKARFNELFFP